MSLCVYYNSNSKHINDKFMTCYYFIELAKVKTLRFKDIQEIKYVAIHIFDWKFRIMKKKKRYC